MVDYTSKSTSSGSLWLYILAGGIVVIFLYALFAGGGPTTVDPSTLSADPAAVSEPAATGAETAPLPTE